MGIPSHPLIIQNNLALIKVQASISGALLCLFFFRSWRNILFKNTSVLNMLLDCKVRSSSFLSDLTDTLSSLFHYIYYYSSFISCRAGIGPETDLRLPHRTHWHCFLFSYFTEMASANKTAGVTFALVLCLIFAALTNSSGFVGNIAEVTN